MATTEGLDPNIEKFLDSPTTAAAPSTSAPATAATTTTSPPPSDLDSIGEAIKGSTWQGFGQVMGLPHRLLGIGPEAGKGFLANTPEETAAMAAHPWISTAGQTAGQLAGTLPAILGTEAVLPAVAGAGLVGRVLANPLVRSALGGAEQNLLTSAESPDESLVRRGLVGAGTGAGFGWLGGKLAGAFGSNAALASQQVADAAQLLKSEGVDLGVQNLPQTGARAFAQGAPANVTQAQQVTSAVGRAMGENFDNLTPATLNPMITRLGQDVGNTAAQGQVDTKLISPDLFQVWQHYGHEPRVQSLMQKLGGLIDPATGSIDGAKMQDFIRAGSPLDIATNATNSDVADGASAIKRALLSGFDQSSPAGVADAYRVARTKYLLARTLQNNVTQSGANYLNPATLYNTVRQELPNVATLGTGGPNPMLDKVANLVRAADTAFGGTGAGPPPKVAGGWLSSVANPATIGTLGAAGAWALHNPIPLIAALGYAGARGLGTLGRYYQQTNPFANKLIARGTQAPANALAPWMGSVATGVLPTPGQGP